MIKVFWLTNEDFNDGDLFLGRRSIGIFCPNKKEKKIGFIVYKENWQFE